MPDDLRHRGILAWAIAQAGRLRRPAAGERVNDLDRAKVIEEVESGGEARPRRSIPRWAKCSFMR